MTVPAKNRDLCPQCGAKTAPVEGVFLGRAAGRTSSPEPWEVFGVCPKCATYLRRAPNDQWRLATRAA